MARDMDTLAANACDMLDNLVKHYNFAEVLLHKARGEEWESDLREYPEDIEFAYGMTRVVFWDPDDCSVVFKVNSTNEHVCENEKYVYDRACEAHLEKFFAWTDKLMDYTVYDKEADEYVTVPVYVSEYCDVDADSNSDKAYTVAVKEYCAENNIAYEDLCGEKYDKLSRDQKNAFEDYMDDVDYESTEGMFELAASLWGRIASAVVYEFINFMNINDLHCANWGFRDDFLVIVDFGGYYVNINTDDIPKHFLIEAERINNV